MVDYVARYIIVAAVRNSQAILFTHFDQLVWLLSHHRPTSTTSSLILAQRTFLSRNTTYKLTSFFSATFGLHNLLHSLIYFGFTN